MKPSDINSSTRTSNDVLRNSENAAMITFVVFLIITFVTACIYIGIDGFLSR